jgi:hypothetical protein
VAFAVLFVLVALTAGEGSDPSQAASQLPDLTIVLVMEVADTAGWVALQDEVLVTPQPGPKPLIVSVAATTGGRRSIALAQPRFDVALIKGTGAFKVTVYGKMGGNEAPGALGVFQYALIEEQAAQSDSEVGVMYGLSTVAARVLEMYVTRP